MIDYVNYELFYNNSNKQIHIVSDDSTIDIDNSMIHSGQFSIDENLCSENTLRFGACESSKMSVKVANRITTQTQGKWLTVTQILDHDTENPFIYGRFKIYSDMPSGDRNFRDIIAYDAMYDIIPLDVKSWYNNLVFPLSLKDFRDSFFRYIGISQNTVSLINDNMLVRRIVDIESLTGKTVVNAICESNGVFGHIDRYGRFDYVSIGKSDVTISKQYIKPGGNYEDWSTQRITKLIVSSSRENTLIETGDSDNNAYIIKDNILFYGHEDGDACYANLFNKIKHVTYTPLNATVKSNPCIELGDIINVQFRKDTKSTYLLQRTISGIQSITGTISSKGTIRYIENTNTITQLRQSIESIRNEITVSELVVTEYVNTSDIEVGNEDTEILCNIQYATKKETYVSLSAEIQLEIQCEEDEDYGIYDAVVTVTYLNDGEELACKPKENYLDGKHILHLIQKIKVDKNVLGTIMVKISVSGGNVLIRAGECKIWLEGTGLIAEEQWDGILRLSDFWTAVSIPEDIATSNYTDIVTYANYIPVGGAFVETMSDVILLADIEIGTYTDNVEEVFDNE